MGWFIFRNMSNNEGKWCLFEGNQETGQVKNAVHCKNFSNCDKCWIKVVDNGRFYRYLKKMIQKSK